MVIDGMRRRGVPAAHGLTRAGLDSPLYRIAADSAMAAAYEAQLR